MKWTKSVGIITIFFCSQVMAAESQLEHVAGHLNSASWSLVDEAKKQNAPVRVRNQAQELARLAYKLKQAVENYQPEWRIKKKFINVSQAYDRLDFGLKATPRQKYAKLDYKIDQVRRRYHQLQEMIYSHARPAHTHHVETPQYTEQPEHPEHQDMHE